MTLQVLDLVVGISIRTSYGFLGWSSISLIHDTVLNDYILLDVGGFNTRQLLFKSLERLGIEPKHISKILITHLHFDHCMNLELFPRATVYISKKELDYIYSGTPMARGDIFIPKPYIDSILKTVNVVEISGGAKVHEDIVAVELPGHTPGSMGYLVASTKTIFVGDAIKNLYELLTQNPTLCFGTRENWLNSLTKVLNLAQYIIPGHDMRIEVKDKSIRRIGKTILITIELAQATTTKKYELKKNHKYIHYTTINVLIQ